MSSKSSSHTVCVPSIVAGGRPAVATPRDDVEDAAIEWLLNALIPGTVDTRLDPCASGGVEIDGRVIEVKASSKTDARGVDVWLEARQYEAAKDNPLSDVWLMGNVTARPSGMRLTCSRVVGL